MSFEERGFLSKEVDVFIADNRRNFKIYFDFADDINIAAHEVLASIKPKILDNYQTLTIVPLYLRVLTSFAAAVTLMERGLDIEAGNVTRSLVESTMYLRKCALEPSWIERYIKTDELNILKIVNSALENPDTPDKERLLARKSELERFRVKEGLKTITVADLAKDPVVNAKGIYDSIYRLLSNTNTHSTPRSLHGFLNVNSDGDVISITYANNTSSLTHLMSACAWAIWISSDAVREFFGMTTKWPDSLGDRFQKLFAL